MASFEYTYTFKTTREAADTFRADAPKHYNRSPGDLLRLMMQAAAEGRIQINPSKEELSLYNTGDFK